MFAACGARRLLSASGFGVHHIVQKLREAVLDRMGRPAKMSCLVFPSEEASVRLSQFLRSQGGDETNGAAVQSEIFWFHLAGDNYAEENAKWGQFWAVLYHQCYEKHATKFWTIFGDGVSSRHAEFCLGLWTFMRSSSQPDSSNGIYQCPVDTTLILPPWNRHCDQEAKDTIRSRIAEWIASDDPHIPRVSPSDVYLYQKGMCAISAVARSLLPGNEQSGGVVVFGWPYSETPKCVENSGYRNFFLYSQGSADELDLLATSLASGTKIQALFCEIPSNPMLRTPDLHRIRELADQYEFCVVCDETLGTYINVDVLPYVDVVITSLTKIFSGGSNVMGGSVVLNPQSRHYETLHQKLSSTYQDNLFPADAILLAHNSTTFPSRVRQCNKTALALASHIVTHPSIQSVFHPSLPSLPTAYLYERYRRSNGGHGYLLSFLFRNPASAVVFYDCLDICKGPNVGTNFSLALPYAQLSHALELDWAESQGVPRHIMRISVGLEPEELLIGRIDDALLEVEKFEKNKLPEAQPN
ncbi:pyridoxal phosphate-dependent transferase [Aspergillus foveolatus]|uniref:pyridoxal phosphate-dependent transferase n=1 Tax=Aspergillus foveolatus TaxID=210207 RepID=UPI003CCD3F02